MSEHLLRVRPDKVASVCLPFKLSPYLSVHPQPLTEEGAAVVARVLTVSPNYGNLELTSGRPAQLVPGDIIVGVLGARAALRGFWRAPWSRWPRATCWRCSTKAA